MSYPGGKGGSGVFQNIINHMPPHRCYIEPFLGSGIIMRMKKPASCSIGIDADPTVIKNFQRFQVPSLKLIRGDALNFLSDYNFAGDELVYLDPPYPLAVRSCKKRIYALEFSSTAAHLELLSIIKKIPAAVIISSYFSDLYNLELSSWTKFNFQTTNRRGTRTSEYLWMNFPQPTELHSYAFLGDNFRERERITRRRIRWTKRLRSLPALERAALLHALNESGTGPA